MATVWVWIVILTVLITLSVCPFNRMAHTTNSHHQEGKYPWKSKMFYASWGRDSLVRNNN
jgi:hypothetical protein